jgi:hypothetical protein
VYDGAYAYFPFDWFEHSGSNDLAYYRLESGEFSAESALPAYRVPGKTQGMYYMRRPKTEADEAIAPAATRSSTSGRKTQGRAKYGYIYCVATKHMPKIVKCGFTTSVDETSARAELFTRYATYWPSPEIVHVETSDKARVHEKLVFSHLARYRMGNSELFKCSHARAIRAIKTVLKGI